MGLSREKARLHIKKWSETLRPYPRNANWPKYLYHAVQVETAVAILKADSLLCRNRVGRVAHDVANQGALRNNPEPHDYARLYFRPRTQFHLKTEGIKCLDDPYRDVAHMSVPVMLAFDAESVLSLEGTGFSVGMLSKRRDIGFDESAFEEIPFNLVYHDTIPAKEDSKRINDHRMAEVVVPAALPLEPHLKRIICRTTLDKRTLLHLLGPDGSRFRERIVVEQVRSSIFLHKGIYLTSINVGPKALLGFHLPSKQPASGAIEVEIAQMDGDRELVRHVYEVRSDQSDIRFGEFEPRPEARWQVLVEKVLAFDAPVSSETSVLIP